MTEHGPHARAFYHVIPGANGYKILLKVPTVLAQRQSSSNFESSIMSEETRPLISGKRERYEDEELVLTPFTAFARKVGAEFIGTFILIFTAAATPIVNKQLGGLSVFALSATPALAVTTIIFSTGHICGAHLNPSVTISFAALGQFPWIQVPVYIFAQLLASVLASFILKGVYYPDIAAGVTVPIGSDLQAFVLELVISFILMFVNTALATDRSAVGDMAAVAVGATVFVNNLAASQATGASMNPARTIGPAIAANCYKSLWVYIVAPTLGCLLGAAGYTIVRTTGASKPKKWGRNELLQ
ncbi:probable aquaporin NIP5-1 isoform X1 [Selaginella moellendorffii]|uniref:probable aquaporin NIP5-1 isoform X1 n=2 Tax=Selaginella moellendorffii TaxID=88036 RepID=UPI000D1C5894|nr:probable aquaporin NIP5-1 isoform X1 [Selaginella moellendorffii]|eukprot:XP_024537241.1 probable aquaporin NIP5-1 isoform X1 [Selaginella moellendorffii]